LRESLKVEALLRLRDAPGMLLSVLDPISRFGGNIVSISHFRERMEGDIVPTLIVFEVKDLAMLDAIRGGFEKARVRVAELKLEGKQLSKKKSFSVIMTGHVMQTDVRDTMDRINALGGQVTNFNIAIVAPEARSSAIFKIDVEERKCAKLARGIDALALEKNLLVIRELESG